MFIGVYESEPCIQGFVSNLVESLFPWLPGDQADADGADKGEEAEE